jgi:hypothetical protein
MTLPVKVLPSSYIRADSVSLKNSGNRTAIVIWSVVLFILPLPLIYLVLLGTSGGVFSFVVDSAEDIYMILGGIVLVSIVMIIVHEGLHGLVFWLTTHERPKFAFKWYYASACAEGWYLPRVPYLIATLTPLVVITAAGLLLLPVLSSTVKYFMALLIVANSSGCAGDVVVVLHLLKLPHESLSFDTGDEVTFFKPLAE